MLGMRFSFGFEGRCGYLEDSNRVKVNSVFFEYGLCDMEGRYFFLLRFFLLRAVFICYFEI